MNVVTSYREVDNDIASLREGYDRYYARWIISW